MRCRLTTRSLSLIVATTWLALSCSGSGPHVACDPNDPELQPCLDHVNAELQAGHTEDLFEELANLEGRHPDNWVVAYLNGYAYFQSDIPDSALQASEYFRETDRLAKEAGEPEGRAQALVMLGAIEEFHGGRIDEALRLYLEAAAQAESAPDDLLYFQAAWSIATSFRQLGRYADQIDWLERALQRLGEDGDPAYRRFALYALGNAYRKLGDWQSSVHYLEQDLDSAIRDEDTEEEVLALQLRANVQLDRDPEVAIPLFERCAERAGEAGLPELQSHLEVLVGVAMVQADKLSEGLARLETTLDRSLAFAEGDFEQTVQGVANLLYLAEAQRRLGQPDSALEFYRRARAKAEEWNKPYFYWQISAGMAASYLQQDKFDEAIREARRGVDQVESGRSTLEDEKYRVYYLRQRSNVYATLAAAVAGGHPEDLDAQFDALERVHSRTLRESLRDRSAAGPAIVSPPLSAIQARLRQGDVLLEYLLGEDRSLLMAVTPDSATLHTLPPRKTIERMIERYRAVLQGPLVSLDARLEPEADFRRRGVPGWELFTLLLQPVRHEIAKADRLIIVPDKQLHRLPFGTLPLTDPRNSGRIRFLTETHELLYLPSAAFLSDPTTRPGESKVVVVEAGSAWPELNLPELTQASVELDRIRQSYPVDSLIALEGNAATPEGLKAALASSPSTLHVIGHAILDPIRGPEIVLPGDRPGSHYLLDAERIVAMAPTPPLVVLSACETGEGELVGGEGILGLVRAFRLSGSSHAVASLWKADDETSSRLMGAFHSALQQGHPPARSLAIARRQVLDAGFAHPFGWGAFVLYGTD